MEDDLDNVLLPAEVPVGIEITPKKVKSTKRISDDVRKSISVLAKAGKSAREIATELGISKTSAASILKEFPSQLPEEKLTTVIEPMDDAAFVAAINGLTNPSGHPPPAAVKDKKELNDVLNSFMRELDAPVKVPKGKKVPVLKNLITDFSVPAAEKALVPVFEDKSVYITKIQMNVDNFADVLKDHIKPDRDSFIQKVCKMSLTDLAQTLKLLETVRSSNNMANQLKYLLYGATSIIELGSQRFLGMRTQGYAEQVRQQEAEIQSCLREIAINNVETYKKIEKPEVRLVSVLVMTLLATDSRNRMVAYKRDFESNNVSEEKTKEFAEL